LARRPGRRPGRPALLEDLPNDEICRKVTRYLKLGCTHATVADQLGIAEDTFYAWVKKYPQFSEAVKAGDVEADADVASALYRNAVGYSHPEEKIFYDAQAGEVVRADTVRHYPPNTASAIFWLKNRRRETWRDIRSTELSGVDGQAIEIQQQHVIQGRQLDTNERDKLRAFLEANVTDVETIDDDATDDTDIEEGDDDEPNSED
jgi:hypothetical protein